jgi:hypothetical protein
MTAPFRPARAHGSHLVSANDEPILPTSLRHEESDINEGANHATKHDDQTEQINPGRRHHRASEIGLTQQATNSTCVTPRRDGATFAAIHEQTQESARSILRAAKETQESIQAECDRCQSLELARMPGGGYLS